VNAPLHHPMTVKWSDERVAQLRRHYFVGLTAAESALLLGGVTRNAVISKRNRLGLVGAPPPSRTTTGDLVGKARSIPRSRGFRPRSMPEFASWPLPQMDQPPPADARPAVLAEHRAGECLWPLGPAEAPADWRALFCCAPTDRGRRYCAAHAARSRR